MGKFGLGVQNLAGQRLIEFCQENALVIANTFFQQHKRRLYTWTSPDGQHRIQIDYILCSQRWRSSIQSAKTRLGAEVQIMNFLLPNSDLNWKSRENHRRRQWQPTPGLLPGKSHGWRNLVGYSPWGRKEWDTTERLHFHFSLSWIGEGNGNPLLAWRIPGMGEPGGLPSMGSHRVGHDSSDLAAAQQQ